MSGLTTSLLGLGTFAWGYDTQLDEIAHMWPLFLDRGGTLVHTSPSFAAGASEEAVGATWAEHAQREALEIVTSVWTAKDGWRLSRTNIFSSLRASLRRLNTDYVDVLVLAGMPTAVPIAETAGACLDLLHSGAVRYFALRGMPPWYAVELKAAGLDVIGFCDDYSLLDRRVDADLTSYLDYSGGGVMATSPLARGVLTGKYRHSIPPTSRAASEILANTVAPFLVEKPRRIVEAMARAAEGLSRPMHDVALGWLLAQPHVMCACIGSRTASQLDDVMSGFSGDIPAVVEDALSEISALSLDYTSL